MRQGFGLSFAAHFGAKLTSRPDVLAYPVGPRPLAKRLYETENAPALDEYKTLLDLVGLLRSQLRVIYGTTYVYVCELRNPFPRFPPPPNGHMMEKIAIRTEKIEVRLPFQFHRLNPS